MNFNEDEDSGSTLIPKVFIKQKCECILKWKSAIVITPLLDLGEETPSFLSLVK